MNDALQLQTPQTQISIEEPYQNPQKLLVLECAEQGYNQGELRATNMEKFREIVIKLANSDPNKPLSETQNSLIHDRFNRLLSLLHTPDHPPYAWMIQRALEELNEKRGSSEESISDFIRKEYHDLPWSHSTLLKHHLEALCECGDIILTHGQHYLLAGADSTVNSGKRCRKKSSRKKRQWDCDAKKRKQRKKDIDKESKEGQMLHEKQNCILEGPKQKNLEAEARKDTPALYIVGEDGEQIEGDQTEILTPERPPGFDSAGLEESSHRLACCIEGLPQATDPTRRPTDVVVSTAEGLSDHQKQIQLFNVYDQLNHEDQMVLAKHGNPETSVCQTLQDMEPMTIIDGIDLQQTNNGVRPAPPSQEMPTELCSQKTPSELPLTEKNAAISESEGKPVNRIVFTYRKRPSVNKAAKRQDLCSTIQEIKDKVLPQKQLKCQNLKQLNDNPMAPSLLQQQLAEHGLSRTNEQQEVKSGAANRSEYQRRLRPRPPKPKQSHARNTAELSPSPHHQRDVEQQPKGHGRHPKPEQSDALMTAELSPSTNQHDVEQQQPKRHGRPPKPEQSDALKTLELSPSPHEHDVEQQQPKRRGRPPKPEQSDALKTLELSPSPHEHDVGQQQPKRRGRPPKPEQSDTLKTLELSPLPHELSSSPHKHDVEQQKPKRRGRPPKVMSDNGVTNDNVVPFPDPDQSS